MAVLDTEALRLSNIIASLQSLPLPQPILSLIQAVLAVSPSSIFRGCFTFAIIVILSLQLTPRLSRGLILDYGPRASGAKPAKQTPQGWFHDALKAVTTYGRIPHSWFNHFYVASVAGSVFWGLELLLGGGVVMRLLAEWEAFAHMAEGAGPGPASMSWEQTVMAWGMLYVQGVRRLYECYFIMRPSKSEMWFVHYIMGMCFYVGIGLAVWIEGSQTILSPPETVAVANVLSLKHILGAVLFLYGWTQQAWCHRYLASLRKYTLPSEGLFKNIVCAHYFCECLIYLGISVAAAPDGHWLNNTVGTALLFVFVNLASTANGTKAWYAEKFGRSKVAPKWRIVPFLF
ncbi:hypothetical protein F5X68DRAFT_46224 [Plectosphaerella plurivora]|uniref:Polyprenal reductase n=1 Tax=Plectosphaerella plurivora TaxID=936078 RepID=A0A9P8VJU1_9PEZI|nr:hypothetical protein F5X68DRAFT_46224 [Plectosphaerella plurivora]